MRAVLVGYGEVGRAVFNYFSSQHCMDIHDPNEGRISVWQSCNVLAVCIPYSKSFVQIVRAYQRKFNPKATIIFSSVQIGTTRKLKNAVHVPVEGKHPNLEESLLYWTFFMGGKNKTAKLFLTMGRYGQFVQVENPEWTEFLKLQSTSNYGLNIEYARYLDSVCVKLKMPYDRVIDYTQAYNRLYAGLNRDNFKRYVLTPPEGNIGGHCVVPNAKLLDERFPSVFLKKIIEEV